MYHYKIILQQIIQFRCIPISSMLKYEECIYESTIHSKTRDIFSQLERQAIGSCSTLQVLIFSSLLVLWYFFKLSSKASYYCWSLDFAISVVWVYTWKMLNRQHFLMAYLKNSTTYKWWHLGVNKIKHMPPPLFPVYFPCGSIEI